MVKWNTRGDLSISAVLSLLGSQGGASRAGMARSLGLSMPAITQIVKKLEQRGLVREGDLAPSNGGRPGRLVSLVGTAGRALGVKVAADHIAITNIGLDGTVTFSVTRPFLAHGDDVLYRLAQAVAPYIDSDGEQRSPLLGIGIAVPGNVVDPEEGSVDSRVLGWGHLPVGRFVTSAFNLPVVVENDVNSLAISELIYGQGRGADSAMVLTIGQGIGLGVISNGSVHRGAHGIAGEIGHIPVPGSRVICQCGRVGCLEANVGDGALLQQARESGLLPEGAGIKELATSAASGESQAAQLFESAGLLLGRVVSELTYVLDPSLIIVAGEGSRYWSLWQSGFSEAFRQYAFAPAAVEFAVDDWEDTKWGQGAASLVLAALFDLEGFRGEQADRVSARLNGE